ncbi:MAG: DUF2497 domain-containing protein [Alphaproteobacteria bacterium]|nr:DUF2497 domain-containing protein [Alphaproteobacteria bacterium]
MAEPSKESDQSMEDILQSIKRIIADDGEAAPTAAGSDVLELTELLAEDAAPPAATPEPAPAPAPAPVAAPAKTAQDDIDALFNAAPAAPEPIAAPAPAKTAQDDIDALFNAPPSAPEPTPAPAPAPVAAAPAEPAPALVAEQIMSDSTLAASVSALTALTHKPGPVGAPAGPALRSGTTVEDLVIEALKPLLREWLDGNLPALVRTLVEREIRRLSDH